MGKVMTLRTTIKIFVPAVGLVTLVLLMWGIQGKFFARKPHLHCEISTGSTMSKDLMPIMDVMKEYAQREIDKKEVKDIALYFDDLKSGVWIGINKDEKFNVASLMKVPLMMKCLESAELHPGLLKKRLLFAGDKDWTLQQNIKPIKSLVPGKSYSLDEIMYRMIAYSDNNAMQLLLEETPPDCLYQYLSDHNIDYEKAPDGFMMSLDTYSWFFKSLYSKSFLNSTMSRKALTYLAAEDFPQGMHAAVPANVVVESKFGEKLLLDENGKVVNTQLHEVGIVLDGDHPFLLGIMTSGKDLTALEKIIRDITHGVYEEMELSTHKTQNHDNCMTSQCHA